MKELGAISRLNRGSSVGTYIQNKFQDLSRATFKVGKVVSVVLDETHPKFDQLGQYGGIGVVEYASDTRVGVVVGQAYPLNRMIRKYPIVGEFVLIINTQDADVDTGPLQAGASSFYIGLIDVWNTVNHNSFPFDQETSTTIAYTTAETGLTNPTSAAPKSYNFGKTFQESGNVKPLQAFEGDVIVEGRWGNAIRLASTTIDKQTKKGVTPWSMSNLNNGSPILLLRNGQPSITSKTYKQVVEDINEDLSSIYLTSNQKINIRVAQTNEYTSYNTQTKPTNATEFIGSQVVLNADRILINAKQDHILLASTRTVNLNATDSINIDTPGNTIIQSKKILLGSATAPEPVLLGNKTYDLLKALLDALEGFMAVAKTTVSSPAGSALGQFNIQAGLFEGNVTAMKQLLEQIKSDTTFTV